MNTYIKTLVVLIICYLQIFPNGSIEGEAKKGLKRALASDNPRKRYWGLIACSSFAEQAKPFYKKAKKLAVTDRDNLVRVRAAEFLGLTGAMAPQAILIEALRNAQSMTEANLILNTITLLQDGGLGYTFDIPADAIKEESLEGNRSLIARRMEYLMPR